MRIRTLKQLSLIRRKNHTDMEKIASFVKEEIIIIMIIIILINEVLYKRNETKLSR